MSEPSPATELVRLTDCLPREKKKLSRSMKQVGLEMGGTFATFVMEANAVGHQTMHVIATVGGLSCLGAGVISYGKMWYHSLRHDHFSVRLDDVTMEAFDEVVQNHSEFRDAFAGIDVLELNDTTEDLE